MEIDTIIMNTIMGNEEFKKQLEDKILASIEQLNINPLIVKSLKRTIENVLEDDEDIRETIVEIIQDELKASLPDKIKSIFETK